MKILKLLVLQILFFTFFSLLTHVLKDNNLLRRFLYLILIISVTTYLSIFIYNAGTVLKPFFINLFSLFFFFELMKYIEFLLGFLPRYNDVPFLIRYTFSFICIAIYVGIITLICFLFRNYRKKKSKSFY
jgi:hypothetical protein